MASMAKITVIERSNPRERVPYDVVFGAVGYETRARFGVTELDPQSNQRIALVFDHGHAHAFKANREFYADRGFNEIPADEAAIEQILTATGERVRNEQRSCLRVWLDVSSITRSLIARFAFVCDTLATQTGVDVQADFSYSPARFYEPASDVAPIVHKGAVIPELSGWSSDPSEPCCAIIGVGYEGIQALGAIEELEPAYSWLFEPSDNSESFGRRTAERNEVLFALVSEQNRFAYHVCRPFELYLSLESLVFGSSKRFRVLFLPFGPKIFALCSILVGLQHLPKVAVWRISGGRHMDPTDKFPDGRITGLRCQFARQRSTTPGATELNTGRRSQRKLDLA